MAPAASRVGAGHGEPVQDPAGGLTRLFPGMAALAAVDPARALVAPWLVPEAGMPGCSQLVLLGGSRFACVRPAAPSGSAVTGP